MRLCFTGGSFSSDGEETGTLPINKNSVIFPFIAHSNMKLLNFFFKLKYVLLHECLPFY